MVQTFDLDIQSGSTSEKVAAGISMGLQLTSGNNLSEIASTLQGTTEMVAGAAMNAPDAFVAKMLDEMMTLLGDAGALDAVNQGVNATQNMIALGKQGITIAKQTASISANVMALAESDVVCIPSVKESFSMVGKSYVEILMSMYETTKQMVIDLYNSMICTSQDAVIDNVVASINGILNQVEPLLDPLLRQKTGHSMHETRMMCNQGFMLYRMLQRVSQENKQKKAREKKAEEAKKNIENTIENTKEDLTNTTNNIANNTKEKINDAGKQIKEEAEKKKQQLKEETKAKVAAMTEDMNKEQIKEQLLEWIKNQSIILQNAFNILIFKDMIDNIKIEIQKLQGQSIENLADFMGVFQAFQEFFELIGITPNSKGLTQDDFKALAIATLSGVTSTAIDVAHQVESNANQVLEENIETGKQIANNAKNTTTNIESEITEQFDDLENNLSQIDIQLTHANINSLLNENNSTTQQQKYYEYSTKEGENDSTADVDMTLYAEPSLYVKDFIKEIFQGEKIDNGNKKILLESLGEAWDTNQEKEFVIETKSHKFIRFYKFKVKVDKEKLKQEEADANVVSNNSNLLNQGTSSLTNNASRASNNINMPDTSDLSASVSLDNFQMPKPSVILDNVDANFHAEGIQAVLAGKVLMFDEIVQLLKIFLPVMEVLKILIHLIENYKINKAYAESNANISLADAFADAARLIQGLSDMLDLKNTNFFTIRSKKVADYCINTFNVTPDRAKMATISIVQTNQLNTYLSTNMIPHELNMLLGTTLYFDGLAIENGGYQDGTFDGIDTLEYDQESGLIYYDKEGRSTITSHIMRAQKKGIKPFIVDVPTPTLTEDVNKLQSFIDAITVQSDEFEGTQSISLQDMNLCPPVDLYEEDENDKIDRNKQYIIEFGDEWTLGEKMEYKIKVKPGQSINDKTILAEIKKNGKWIPIRSKFTNGVVKETKDHKFFRLYPDFTDRHIIIGDVSISDTNPGMSMGVDLDVNDVSKYGTNMSNAVELGQFILNNMVPSTLPIILFNSNRLDSNHQSTTIASYKNNVNNFNNAVNTIIDNAGLNGGEDSPFVKKINGIKDPKQLQSVGDDLLNMNESLFKASKDYYKNAKNIKAYGSHNFEDCTRLAIGGNTQLKTDNDTIPYYNYYTNLLMRVHDSKNEYVLKYKQILKNIIANRIEREKYNLNYLIDEFNTLYRTYFISTYAHRYENENFFSKLERDYNSIIATAHDSVNKQVNDLIKNQNLEVKESDDETTRKTKQETIDKVKAQVNNEDSVKKREFDKFKDYIMQEQKKYTQKESNELSNFVLQLTNLFYFVKEVEDIETLKTHVKQVTTSDMIKQHFNDIFKSNITNDQDNPLQTLIDKFKFKPSTFTLTEQRRVSITTYFKNIKENVSTYIIEELIESLVYYMKLQNGNQINESKFNFIISYELIKEEAKEIQTFWDDILKDESKCNVKSATEEFKNFANSLSANATWPEPMAMNIENIDFELYLFSHHKALEQEKAMPEIDLGEAEKMKQQAQGMANGDLKTPTATIDDLGDPSKWPAVDKPQLGQITIFDYEYWLVYMLNATIITLLPMYWGDGFDIPPFMIPLPLPAIYFPIAPPVHIHVLSLNVLIVFGLALRGMWPAPIILFVNMSDRPIDVMLPVMMALDGMKMLLELVIMLMENLVPSIINGLLNQYNMESMVMKKKEDKFKIYKALIQSIPAEDKALIEQEFKKSLHEEMDRRQVVTRTEKLGQGPDPM